MGNQDGSAKPPTAVTEFDLEDAPANPTKPDFISEGKIMNAVAVDAAATATSKSVKVEAKTASFFKRMVYITSSQAGTYKVQVLLDESELSGGNPVWRTIAALDGSITAGATVAVGVDLLARQIRITFTAGGSACVVSAWVFSV